MRLSTIISALALLITACSTPEDQPVAPPKSPQAALRTALTNAAEKTKAGAILDVQGCGLDFLDAKGVANRSTDLPMPTDEKIRLASIGKLYTAAVIHQLASQERLDLDSPATTYLKSDELKGVPNKSATLRQLLNHTSGVPDYYDARSYIMWNWEQPITTDRVLKVARRRSATGEIGETYSYSNTNYHILALVAEEVSGDTLTALIQLLLLEPLQLTDTRYNTAHSGGTIHGYGTILRPWADTWKYAENTGPDSGITATTDDLRRLLQALFLDNGSLNKIGSQMIHDPVKTAKERQLAGPGSEIFVGRSGLWLIGHTGDTYGYLSFAMAIPEHDATLIGHINANNPDALVGLLSATIATLKQECAAAEPDNSVH